MSISSLLDGIAVFVEVIKRGSFTLAAEHSGHSSSYISKEINKLEERLGVRLLHRTTRSLKLTPEGELYFQQCQQIVDDAKAAELALSGHQLEPQGSLKISCPVSFGISQLNPIIAEFMQCYPKIKLELDLNDRKVDLINDGFDIAIRASGRLEDSSLISRRIFHSHGVVVAAPSYVERHGKPSCPSELVNHQTISYSNLDKPEVWQFKDTNGEEIQVSVKSRVLTNSSQMELSLCMAGHGITRLPAFNLTDELEQGKLIELFADLPKQPIDVFLVYPSRKHLAAKVRCFIDFVLEKL